MATGDTDFRSPEHLNLWLKEKARQKEFPTLASFVRKRFEKRDSNVESFVALGEWVETHQQLSVAKTLGKMMRDENVALELAFALPYALKRSGKTLVNANEADMQAALRAFEGGLLRRD